METYVQESKSLSSPDLCGGSAKIGFVEYGLPYFIRPDGFCVSSTFVITDIFTTIYPAAIIDLGFIRQMIDTKIVKPFLVVISNLSAPFKIIGTIAGTCGGNVRTFQKGETVVISATIRDPDGKLFSPDTGVFVEVRTESGKTVIEETPATETSTGVYTADIQTDEFKDGEYIVIFKAVDGSRIAIDWDRFRIESIPEKEKK